MALLRFIVGRRPPLDDRSQHGRIEDFPGFGGAPRLFGEAQGGAAIATGHPHQAQAGIGIERQSVDKIFESFYTTKPQGMGMGLAISRSIVENHGGTLRAVRNDGPGMRFELALPAIRS